MVLPDDNNTTGAFPRAHLGSFPTHEDDDYYVNETKSRSQSHHHHNLNRRKGRGIRRLCCVFKDRTIVPIDTQERARKRKLTKAGDDIPLLDSIDNGQTQNFLTEL
mmetsp:Transcript_37685/g.53145  ORF Transcript_37685/g.53145 Transcript_37685/m.53145 type:complete len:106 (+) Transcript_37685:253-570(+)